MSKEKKYIATVDIPALGLKAGDPVEGPVADVMLANGKAEPAAAEQKKGEAGK